MKFKKTLHIFLAFFLLFSTTSIEIEKVKAEEANDLPKQSVVEDFEIDSNGRLVAYNGDAAEIIIPDTVLQIANGVFANKGITKVIFPNGLQGIESGAFEGNKLTSLTFPQSLYYVDQQAFANNHIDSIVFLGYQPSFGEHWISNQAVDSTSIMYLETMYWFSPEESITNVVGNFELWMNHRPITQNNSYQLEWNTCTVDDLPSILGISDPDGDELTIEYFGEVDFSTPGDYYLSYHVTDSYGQMEYGWATISIVKEVLDFSVVETKVNKSTFQVGDVVEFEIEIKTSNKVLNPMLEVVSLDYKTGMTNEFGVYLTFKDGKLQGNFTVLDSMQGKFGAYAIKFATSEAMDAPIHYVVNKKHERNLVVNFNGGDFEISNTQPNISSVLGEFIIYDTIINTTTAKPGDEIQIELLTERYEFVKTLEMHLHDEEGYTRDLVFEQTPTGYLTSLKITDFERNGVWTLEPSIQYESGPGKYFMSVDLGVTDPIQYTVSGATKTLNSPITLLDVEATGPLYVNQPSKIVLTVGSESVIDNGSLLYCSLSDTDCEKLELSAINATQLEGMISFKKLGEYRLREIILYDKTGNFYHIMDPLAIGSGWGTNPLPGRQSESLNLLRYRVETMENKEPKINGSDMSFVAGTKVLEDMLKEVSATDYKGNSINATIKEHNIDFNKVGTYVITYTADDGQGNVTTVSYQVKITENQKPTIQAKDVSFKAGTGSLEALLEGVIAYDEEDGDLKVTIKTHNIDFNKVGSYSVTYTTTDTFKQSVDATIKVVITATALPTIVSKDLSFTLGTANQNDLLNGVTANDETGKTIVVSVNSHTVNFNLAGTYEVTYEAVDAYGSVKLVTNKVTILSNATEEPVKPLPPVVTPSNPKPESNTPTPDKEVEQDVDTEKENDEENEEKEEEEEAEETPEAPEEEQKESDEAITEEKSNKGFLFGLGVVTLISMITAAFVFFRK